MVCGLARVGIVVVACAATCEALSLAHTQRRNECVAGGHLNGTWEFNAAYPLTRYSVRLSACDFGPWEVNHDGYYNKAASYRWVPNSCDLVEFNADSFCKSLGQRDILFVGDSTTFMQVQSLSKMLKPGSSEEPGEMDVAGSKMSICDGRMLHFVRNDQLVDEEISQAEGPHSNSSDPHDPEYWKCGDVCFPWVRHLKSDQVLVLNSGIHAYTGYGSDLGWYRANLEKVANHLRTHYTGTLLFRTTVAGHENCARGESGPVRFGSPIPIERQLSRRKSEHRIFNWETVGQRNAYAKEIFKASGNWHVLDVEPMTRSRADGHCGQEGASNDCLHYQLPGPPDWWNVLFHNWLVGQVYL